VKRALPTAALPLLLVSCAGIAGCDTDLEDLRVLVWQPEALANGAGDLLDDAVTLSVLLTVDGEPQSFSLQEGRSVTGRLAAPAGSDVSVVLSTRGADLPAAFGRSGLVHLSPGEGAVDVSLLLAPPTGVHLLSGSRPDARVGLASCSAPDGRVWLTAGSRGGGLVPGSFVIDPLARDVVEGPGLAADRTRASCIWDGANGVYLLGGCALDGTAAGGLLHAPTGSVDQPFVLRAAIPDAGCGAQLVRTASGMLLAFTGDRLVRFSASDDTTTDFPLQTARYFAQAVAVGESVLLAGGFTDESAAVAVPSASLVRVGAGGVTDETSLPFDVDVLGTTDSRGVIAVVGVNIVHVRDDGSRQSFAGGVIPAGFVPAAVARAGLGGAAVLSAAGDELLVVDSAGVTSRLVVDPARPGGALHADPGGAVRIVGGGEAGVHAVVVE